MTRGKNAKPKACDTLDVEKHIDEFHKEEATRTRRTGAIKIERPFEEALGTSLKTKASKKLSSKY